MIYQILQHPKAAKELDKLKNEIRDKFKAEIRKLSENPKKQGKKLHPTEFYRIRVGDYRVIYEVWKDEKKVIILFVGHRSKVYYDFKKFL